MFLDTHGCIWPVTVLDELVPEIQGNKLCKRQIYVVMSKKIENTDAYSVSLSVTQSCRLETFLSS